MHVVTLSSKYQVVIPAALRKQLDLQPGQKMVVVVVDGHLQLVPLKPIRSLRGFVKGISTEVPREEDRL